MMGRCYFLVWFLDVSDNNVTLYRIENYRLVFCFVWCLNGVLKVVW